MPVEQKLPEWVKVNMKCCFWILELILVQYMRAAVISIFKILCKTLSAHLVCGLGLICNSSTVGSPQSPGLAWPAVSSYYSTQHIKAPDVRFYRVLLQVH